jgi:hypothetical protein
MLKIITSMVLIGILMLSNERITRWYPKTSKIKTSKPKTSNPKTSKTQNV